MRRRDALRGVLGAVVGLGGRAAARHPDERGEGTGTRTGTDGFAPRGHAGVAGAAEAVVGDDGTTAFLAATDGFAVVDVTTPSAPEVLAERRSPLADREDGPLAGIHDVAVEGDRLLVVGPAHGRRDGLRAAAVYDVSTPAAPTLAGVHRTAFPIHNATLADGVAYLTGNDGDRNPLVAVDVRDEPAELGRWSLLDHDPAWADVAPGLRVLHDVTVREGTAVLAHWDAGTWLLDVSDPSAPAYLGHAAELSRATLAGVPDGAVGDESTRLPGNAHYAALDPTGDLLAVGREAWDVAGDGRRGGPGGIDLYDASDPAAPARVGHVAAPATPDATIDGTWTTAHNFDLAGGRLYASWYRGGVTVHDVRDPVEPRPIARWRDGTDAAFWTARRARDCVVASSFRGRVGLHAFPDPPASDAPRDERRTTGDAGDAGDADDAPTGDGGPPRVGAGVAALAVGAAAWRRLRGRS